MKNYLILLCFLLIGGISLQAQCPPSNDPGIHIVQQDENLYRISLKYGISVSRLCALNNMSETDLLPACKKLRISDQRSTVQQNPQVATNTTYSPNSNLNTSTQTSPNISGYTRQSGKRHVVQAGETMAGLAELYGYTETRFREFNAMGNERITAGSILLSHDCACDRVAYPEDANPFIKNRNNDVVRVVDPSTTTYYGGGDDRRIVKHEPILPTETVRTQRPTQGGGTAPTNTSTNSGGTGNSTTSTAAAPYMRSLELDMLNEINMMRANPPAYIKYINEYVADQRANNGFPVDQAVVDELNRELRKLGPLSQLKPKECVYIAAKKHGQDIIKMGRTDHVGSDGKWPWDRVRRECPDLQDGNENLVGGPDNVRESVVILLIDEGIPNRGHRKTLLRSDWVYGACFSIGKVGMMPNCWVQKFGF